MGNPDPINAWQPPNRRRAAATMGDMTEPVDHVGTSGRPHPLTRCRPDFCGQQPSTGTWGAPILPSGIDDYSTTQQPDPRPVDDLSRFVLERIRDAETEPHVDGLGRDYYRTGYAMAHRYAGHVRADMVAFRRIVAAYCEKKLEVPDIEDEEDGLAAWSQMVGLSIAVRSLAMRWPDHPDFDTDWRLQ